MTNLHVRIDPSLQQRLENDLNRVSEAFAQLGMVMTQSLTDFAAALANTPGFKALMDFQTQVIQRELEDYLLNHAAPEDVVAYIVKSPNHTWMGVTICPDEAWRYAAKSDWMWWRR